MRTEIKNFIVTLCFLAAISFSCKKEQKVVLEFDTQTTEDNALAEGTFADVSNIVSQAMVNGSGGLITYRTIEANNSPLSGCATVTVTPNGAGGSVVVDFGTSNCMCRDSKYRRGIIQFTYTGAYMDSGTVINTTFNNYYVGKDTTLMFKIAGTKTVTCHGLTPSGYVYQVEVNGTLTDATNRTMSWTSSRIRTWVSGYTTLGMGGWNDDQYTITGTASGTNFEGNSFTVNITSPIHIDYSCRWIAQGIMQLTPTGKATRTLDFGNGTCDNLATVTVNGQTFTITLR